MNMKTKNFKAMKKAVSIITFLVLIIAFNSNTNAQQGKQPFLSGTEIIVPFSTTIADTASWERQGKEVLMKVEKLTCSDKDYEIISFTVISLLDQNVVEVKSQGNVWTTDIKNLVKKLYSGDTVWIEGIKTKGPDGQIKMLKNVIFRIQ
jgi:hypothetical protein